MLIYEYIRGTLSLQIAASNILQEPKSKGRLQPSTSIRYPTTGVKANCTKALEASKAPNGPLSSSKVSYFLWRGLKDAGPKWEFSFATVTFKTLENR